MTLGYSSMVVEDRRQVTFWSRVVKKLHVELPAIYQLAVDRSASVPDYLRCLTTFGRMGTMESRNLGHSFCREVQDWEVEE